MRQREKAITIERDHRKTTFHIHDVNFANIDDWDVLKQNLSADGSSMSGSANVLSNTDLAERSIRQLIEDRRNSIRQKLAFVTENPSTEHRNSESINPVKL